MNLKTVPYTRLHKLEIAAFAEDVIYIIKRNNPELLNIEKVYNMLVDQQSNIDLLTEEYGAHPITQLIIPVRRKFIRYVRSIVYRMNLVVFEDANNLSADVLDAQAVTKDYLYRLDRCRSEREKIGRVTGFLQEIDNSEEINATFTKFQLMGDVEFLRNAHSTLRLLLKRRIHSIAENPHIKMRKLTAPVIKALKNMFKQVEIAVLVNDEPEYLNLFYELNEIIVEYKNMVNRRLLHNEKKNKVAKENEPIKEEAVFLIIEDAQAPKASNMNIVLDNDGANKLEKQVNPKSIVASMTKNPPLPKKNVRG